jgi:hypothetical protein
MARRTTDSLIFDTLRLEGGLFVPAVLEKAARGEHTAQKAADYRLPKGLALVDEQGRAFRIASALQKTFEPTRARTDVDANRATIGFVTELLRDALGYSDLTLCTEPVTLADRAYPVTAFAVGGRLPVIIAPHHLELDEPAEYFAIVGSGARRRSAYQLAQQFLNASAPCTWAILTNGRQLRLVRDADTLTRPAFLEADLDLILRAQRYPDFAAVWRLFHASRAGAPDASGESYPWESWKTEGQAQGERVREGLRIGVTDALLALGTGFLSHPANQTLLDRLQSGELSVDGYFQQLLRLIYRCLFLFTAEERELLHAEDTTPAGRHARDAYAQGYAFRRLRARALRRSGFDRHGDLWTACRIVFRSLSTGEARLALPALGGLFSSGQCPDLDAAALENCSLLTAMRHLRWSGVSGQLAAIDYRNMGPEELGSVYESLLELVPRVDLPTRTFGFVGITESGSTSGNARKTSGSYYTPDSLVQELIKSALDPVIAQKLAAQPDRPIEALLSITVCDPSCGSGHFLLAAARRLAEKLAELRALDGAVRPDDYRHALREVASRCLYGVDINPMAVELCRVALWLETVDPGKPLGFLDHHIRTGNSLLGTTPDLIAGGLPDDTFTAIEGDDKAACAELKKRNKGERKGFGPLFQQEEQTVRDRLRQAATAIEELDENDLAHRDKKEAEFKKAETAADYRHAKQLADLWCAAFVIKKHYPAGAGVADTAASEISNPKPEIAPVEGLLLHAQDELFGQPASTAAKTPKQKQPKAKNPNQGTAFGITTRHLRDFVEGRPLPADLEIEVHQLATQYHFFHWHLAFPQVFAQGGFDCILGNPPWDMQEIKDNEFFASEYPQLLAVTSAKEKAGVLATIATERPALWESYTGYCRIVNGQTHLIMGSGRFPHSATGRLNLYRLFVESSCTVISTAGRVGMIIPSGFASDTFAQAHFRSLFDVGRIYSFWDFENREGLFPSVDSRYRFAALTIGGTNRIGVKTDFIFFAHSVNDLRNEDRHVAMSHDDLTEINPISGTPPQFRTAREFAITSLIHSRSAILCPEEAACGWGVKTKLMFMMNAGMKSQQTAEELIARDLQLVGNRFVGDSVEWLPFYEGKMVGMFDHRAAGVVFDPTNRVRRNQAEAVTDDQHTDPKFLAMPVFWLSSAEVASKCGEVPRWFIAVKDVTSATNERTVIGTILPPAALTDSVPWLCGKMEANQAAALLSSLLSFACDFVARQKVNGLHLRGHYLNQLPVPPPAVYAKPCPWANITRLAWNNTPTLGDWLLPRVLELTYTAWDLEAFANECGWNGSPFRWDEERRFLLRCELDAAFFHLYLGSESEWQQQPEALTRAFAKPRHAVAYIMDTFPIVKRKDEAKHGGVYRTKETILQIYDALQESIRTGQPYQTRLAPPPADPRCCHPPRDVAAVVPTSSPIQAVSLPQAPRVPYKSEDIPHYLNFLVYAWAKKGEDRANLRTVVRAFTLLQFPQRISSRLHSEEPGAKDWLKSFREPIKGHTLRPVIEALIDRKALSLVRHPSGEIILKLSDTALAVKIPGAILQDADFSLRAAGIELSKEPPLTPTETTEFEHIASLVSSF